MNDQYADRMHSLRVYAVNILGAKIQGLPGYYSPYYDESTGETFPGTPCSACHDTDLMESLDTDESCGETWWNSESKIASHGTTWPSQTVRC